MHDVLVLLRIVGVFALLFGVPIFFALRAMARRMRDEARVGENDALRKRLLRKFVGIAIFATIASIKYGDWVLVLGFGGLAVAFVTIIITSGRAAQSS